MANLNLKNVYKKYESVEVIHGINLDINDGEFVVFVGPSGCGKSTLLRMIAGLEDITSGDVFIDDESVLKVAAADRGVAMVFQSYALYPHMTVRQNLSFGLENIRMPKVQINDKVNEAAKILQIENLLDRKPKQLSGGQRQRVAIGRATTRDPKIFLFDEPLSNLDAELRVFMRMEITKLHAQLGNTMIYVTHDQIEAMTMADKIVVLRDGVVEQVGAPLDLFNQPNNLFVAGFIGSPRMNFVEGNLNTQTNDGIIFESGQLPSLILANRSQNLNHEQKVTIGIRPEDLLVSNNQAHGWPLTVSVTEQHGANSYLHCNLPDGSPILIHQSGQSKVVKGDVIHVTPRENSWHLFNENGIRIRTNIN